MRRQARRESSRAWIASGATVTIKTYARRYGVDRYRARDRAVARVHRRGDRTGLEEIQLVGGSALARYDRSLRDLQRLERARDTRQAHAIEIFEVRDEAQQSFEIAPRALIHGGEG